MSIVYILESFPSPTETFISNEIKALRMNSVEIVICAVRKGKGFPSLSFIKSSTSTKFFNGSLIIFLRAYKYLIEYGLNRYVKALCEVCLSNNQSLKSKLKDLKALHIAVNFLFQLKGKNATHLHAHFLTFPTRIAFFMSKLANIPYSCSAHAHDIFTSKEDDLLKKIKESRFIVTCTKYNKEYLENIVGAYDSSKIFHIYHGIDVKEYPCLIRTNKLTGIIRLLCVARLVEKKGIKYLIETIDILQKKGFLVKCFIVGEGPQRNELENLVRTKDLEESVAFIGGVSIEEVKKYYYESDIFILPCVKAANGDQDGLPNVLLEAMASGLPVISTNLSAIPELIINNKTGLLIPFAQPSTIADAVLELRDNFDLYKSFSLSGRRIIENKFKIEESTAKLAELFFNK